MRQVTHNEVQTSTTIITTSNGAAIDVRRAKVFSCQVLPVNATMAAKTFVVADQTANTLTITAHGFVTGLKGQASNSGGALPTGISAVTDYFIVVVDANTVKLSDTLAHALAGTDIIDITGAGTGTQTFTPTSIAGLTGILQKSNDYSTTSQSGTWDNISTATSMTAGTHYWFTATDPEYSFVRLQLAITAGAATVTNNIIVKEDL